MKLSWAGLFIVFLLCGAALIAGGCGETKSCRTSLVTLDETRLDAETYEQEAAETAKSISDLEKKLADTKSNIATVKDKPAELQKQADVLKKGSGRE